MQDMSSINTISKEKDMDIDFSAIEQLLTNIGWIEGILYVIGGLFVYTAIRLINKWTRY